MTLPLSQLLIIFYTVTLSIIFLFSLVQLHLLIRYWSYHCKDELEQGNYPALNLIPRVTIQLPIYNEKYVIERLIDRICGLNYPQHLLDIQVLDDSTDETSSLVRQKTSFYSALGFDISHIKRQDRQGYKAGALARGMKLAKGEYTAIFDADFLPKPNFLLKTMPYFANPEIGVVQTRWEHLNESHSIITRLQAFQLNVHFRVEQSGRYASEYLLQFNGTAGVWRKKAILEAGGWKADTLTEDLDLSYRAQLKGWKRLAVQRNYLLK